MIIIAMNKVIIIAMNKAIIIFMNKASMDKVLILFRWLRRFFSWLALWPVEEPPPGNTNTMNTMITNTMNTMITNTMNP